MSQVFPLAKQILYIICIKRKCKKFMILKLDSQTLSEEINPLTA